MPASGIPLRVFAAPLELRRNKALVPVIVEAYIDGFRFTEKNDKIHDRIDIAFMDPFFLQDSIGQVIIEEYIQPRHIILMHVREAEIDNYEKELGELFSGDVAMPMPRETDTYVM